MKKFLIGVIFIIPIVVVIALSATGAIIGMATPVNPEDMVIKDSNNVEIDKNAIIKIDSKNFDEFLIIDVLPQITQNKVVTYERIEEAGDGEVYLEQIGETNRYAITPIKIGVTKLLIRAKANINVYREITFYVSSDSIEGISIYGEDGQDVGEYLDLTSATRLFVDILPIEALRDNLIQWECLPSGVVGVTQNGYVNIIDHGLARISVKAVDKDGNTVSDYVDVDTTKAVINAETVYVEEEVDTDWIKANVVLQEDATVVANGGGVFTVSYEGEDYTVTTIITSSDEWDVLEIPSTLYTRNGGYNVAIYNLLSKEVFEEGFSVQISNPEVLEYDTETAMLIPLSAGTAIMKVTCNGETKEREFVIRENPIAFELELSTGDEKLGIQMTRTWGNYWLTDGNELTRSFKFGLLDKSNTFDVVWEISNPEAVSFERVENSQDIVLTFSEKAEGESITVTAKLKVNNQISERVKRSFTFNMREEANSVNVYNFNQARWVRDYCFTHIVLQNDIVTDERLINLTASVYGNGFKWDTRGVPNSEYNYEKGAIEYSFEHFYDKILRNERMENYEWLIAEFDASSKHQNVTPPESVLYPKPFVDIEITFEDIIFINANSIEESAQRGCGIRIRGVWDEARNESFAKDYPCTIPVNCRFIQVYNAHRGFEIGYTYDVLIEGCILGDVDETCIFTYYFNQEERKYGTHGLMTFRNNVFKISEGPSILFSNVAGNFKDAKSDINYAPNIVFDGFNDFYNWKTTTEFQESIVSLINNYIGMAVQGDSNEANALGSAIETFLRPTLKTIVQGIVNPKTNEKIVDLYYQYAGENYVSFGMFGLGALFTFDPNNITVKDNSVMIAELPFRNTNGEPAGKSLASLENLLSNNYESFGLGLDTICNPSTIVCTNFASGEPEIQPGDPIPNSIELYEKLRGEK